jgi:hypothetical protein
VPPFISGSHSPPRSSDVLLWGTHLNQDGRLIVGRHTGARLARKSFAGPSLAKKTYALLISVMPALRSFLSDAPVWLVSIHQRPFGDELYLEDRLRLEPVNRYRHGFEDHLGLGQVAAQSALIRERNAGSAHVSRVARS